MLFYNGKKGFTLIELILVLFILGLVTGLALPVVNRAVERFSTIAFSKQLAADIRHVRLRNINGEASPFVYIYLEEDKYIIRKEGVIEKTIQAPDGVRLSLKGFSMIIYFTALGVPSGEGATTIEVVNSYGHIYQVIIMVNTGRVRVQPHETKW